MRKTTPDILFACAIVLLACSCNGAKSPGTLSPEFYSGIFTVTDEGEAVFTDCATRITMHLERSPGYESLRREYSNETPGPESEIRVEFHGRLLTGRGDGSAVADPDGTLLPSPLPVVQIDSLLALDKQGGCRSDYPVSGLYRGGKQGQTSILRMRPYYTYTIEDVSEGDGQILSRGDWHRTSLLTIELVDKETGETTSFQIIPARDSLVRTGEEETEVYAKQWL